MPHLRTWPDWVPAAVAQEADELLQSIGADRTTPPDPKALRAKYCIQGLENHDRHVVETFELIQRLICDDRMRAVWGELQRHRRTSSAYLHPARFRNGPRPDRLQELALRQVLYWAVSLKFGTFPTITQQEFDRMREPLATAEAQLRAAMEQAEKLELGTSERRADIRQLHHKCAGDY
jgi:hypothetical protein